MPESRVVIWCYRLTRAASLAALGIGVYWLAAWATGKAAQWGVNHLTVKTNMALCQVLAGIALFTRAGATPAPARRVGLVAAGLVLFIATATVLEHLLGIDLHIDQLLAQEPPGTPGTVSPNRMGPPGSLSLVLLGSGLLALGTRYRRCAPYLGLLVLLITAVPAVGYLYNISELFSVPSLTGVAWPTLIALAALAGGLILACSDAPPLSLLLRGDPGGILLRRMLPAAILIPIILAFLKARSDHRGLMDEDVSTGLLVIALGTIFSVMLWFSAAALSRMHGQQAEGRRAQAMLAAVVESSADAIISEASDGTILSWNAGAQRLFGYTAAEAVGRHVSLIFPQNDGASPQQREELEGTQTVRRHEVERRRQDGSTIYVSVSVSPVVDRNGVVIGRAKIAHDVTNLRRVHEKLQAARETAENARAAAEAASKAKDHFLAVLSHELRTPLTPVLATASLLEHDVQFPDRYRDDIGMIRRNVELEAHLIDDLLDVTRIVRGKLDLHKRPVELTQIIQRALDVCRSELGARRLNMSLVNRSQGPFPIDADPVRMQQVFWNLLKNAIKFTPEGGRIEIRCHSIDGQVVTEVTDSGIGIETDMLHRLFTPFEQGDVSITRQFGGLGLGLVIAKGLVQMHGGTLVAHSPGRGRGATFRVALPLACCDSSAGSSEATEPLGASDTAPPLKILLVEDHADTARVVQRLFRSRGFHVSTAASVAAALDQCASGAFDLIISDLGLPDGTGIELLQKIRATGNLTPAIALSGFGREEDLQSTANAGFSTHLTKPISAERLAQAALRIAASSDNAAAQRTA